MIRFPLHGPRLVVRPMVNADAEPLLALYGDRVAMAHLTSDPPRTVADAHRWVQAKIDLYRTDDQLSMWAVLEADTLEVVGDVGLQHEDYGRGPEVGLGIRIRRNRWGRGYGTEAGRLALAAGFEQRGLERIGAETGPANTATHTLLERLGMTRQGATDEGWPVYRIDRATWASVPD